MPKLFQRVFYVSFFFIITACSTSNHSTPSHHILGTWVSERPVTNFSNGKTTVFYSRSQLIIKDADHNFFRATKTWKIIDNPDARLEINNRKVNGGTEELIGIKGVTGRYFHFLEKEDNGHLQAYLLSPNRLQVMYLEQGHEEATVFGATYTRVK